MERRAAGGVAPVAEQRGRGASAKRVRRGGRWLAGGAGVVPVGVVEPRWVAAEIVVVVLVAVTWVRVRFAPGGGYERPLWWCRARLAWWGWRADRRYRRR